MPDLTKVIRHVGVWTGLRSLGANAAPDVAFCRAHNINRLDVFVNSLHPHDHAFHIHNVDEIADLCQRAQDAGMSVHLTSWIEPFPAFIDAAAEQLIPLAERVGAESLVWDAEEPWNRHEDVDYEQAASAVAEAFASLSCPMSVSGIINTRASRFGPLAAVCDVLVPQCYATSRNNLDPRSIVARGVARWRETFGRERSFIVGLAGYRQSEVHGMSTREAMIASLVDVAALAPKVDTVSYWSLGSIRRAPAVADLISEILAPRTSEAC